MLSLPGFLQYRFTHLYTVKHCDTFERVLQMRNQHLLTYKAYEDFPLDLSKFPFRYILHQSYTRSLYRQFNRLYGINTNQPAHVNLHERLDDDSPQFNPALRNAIYHYGAPKTLKIHGTPMISITL